MSSPAVRWNIFAGIVFSVIGMCLLNYYSLFPEADLRDEKKYHLVDTQSPAPMGTASAPKREDDDAYK